MPAWISLHWKTRATAQAAFLTLNFTFAANPTSAEELQFEIRCLTIDANEGIAAADIDHDGKVDLVAGRNWYRNGDWVARPLRNIDDWNGYVESNGDYIFDVNEDGFPDVVAGSFLPTEIHWYENPGKDGLRLGKLWQQHLLLDTQQSQNEGGVLEDLNGDGIPELIVNRWKKDTPLLVQRFVRTAGRAGGKDGKSGAANSATYSLETAKLGNSGNGHGLAVGDINGDGNKDVLVGQGWYEQPAKNPWTQPWKFHPSWDLHSSLPMIVTDLNLDGRNDLIFGNGHDYGLFWWKNEGADENGEIQWKKQEIDKSYSQPHSLAWADLTGDSVPELITGKRYYAHNGNDPGGQEMPCLYYYVWNESSETFARHTIEEGHVGTGLQIVVEDFDADGDADLAVAGKSGTYLITNKRL